MIRKIDRLTEGILTALCLLSTYGIIFYFFLNPLAKPYTYVSTQSTKLSLEQGINYYEYSVPIGNAILWLFIWLTILLLSFGLVLESKKDKIVNSSKIKERSDNVRKE